MTRPIVALGILLMLVSLTIGVAWQNYDPYTSAEEVDDGGYSTIVAPTGAGKISEPTREDGVTKITAIANDGYVFQKWTVQKSDGSETDYADSETITVDLDHAIYKAIFQSTTTTTEDTEIPKFYTWACPVFSNGALEGYEIKTFSMYIAESDYTQAHTSSTQRMATVSKVMPVDLVQPNDPYIQKIAAYLANECNGLTDIQRAYVITCFVQDAITYRYDILQYGTNEYWALPVETLYSQCGDCEDTAILLCSVASAMGVNSALVAMQTSSSGHMGAAIAIPYGTVEGATFTGTDGREYAYCETATDPDRSNGGEWMIGKLPAKYSLDGADIALIEPMGV